MMSNFKLKVIKVYLPGESFWMNVLGEDDRYIYGAVANELLTTTVNYGDLVKLNKQTNKLTRFNPLQKNIVTIFNDGLPN